jgi:hypothetical protein
VMRILSSVWILELHKVRTMKDVLGSERLTPSIKGAVSFVYLHMGEYPIVQMVQYIHRLTSGDQSIEDISR